MIGKYLHEASFFYGLLNEQNTSECCCELKFPKVLKTINPYVISFFSNYRKIISMRLAFFTDYLMSEILPSVAVS